MCVRACVCVCECVCVCVCVCVWVWVYVFGLHDIVHVVITFTITYRIQPMFILLRGRLYPLSQALLSVSEMVMSCKDAFLVIEKAAFPTKVSPKDIIAVLFSSFFVFNVHYIPIWMFQLLYYVI